MNETIFSRVRFFMLLGIAFLIPLELFAVSVIAGLLFLLHVWGIASGKVHFRKEELRPACLFAGFWFFLALTLAYTHNLSEGWFDLQVKLSLLVFPLCFTAGQVLSGKETRSILLAFGAGIIVAAAADFVHSLFVFHSSGDATSLFYSSLSMFVHPSYMAMYVVFAMLVIIQFIPQTKHFYLRIALLLSCCFLAFFLTMLQSKAGLITAVVFVPLFAFTLLLRSRKNTMPLIAAALMFGAYYFTNANVVTHANDRIFNAMYNIQHLQEVHVTGNGAESSEVRVNIWRSAGKIIRQHWITGVGIGDVEQALLEQYGQDGISAAVEKKLNAHDQYFQVWIASGIGGVLLLLAGFFVGAWRSFRRRQYLYLAFIGILAANLIVESMFETQAGTIFAGFFNSFFFFLASNEKETSTHYS